MRLSMVILGLLLLGCVGLWFQNCAKAGYQTPTQQSVKAADEPVALRAVRQVKTVDAELNKVDLLFVFDNSNSMLSDNQKLATKLSGFVSALQSDQINWQACATVTSTIQVAGKDYWGASVYWVGNTGTPPYLLRQGTANLSQIFADTVFHVGAGWLGTDDERGIKAALQHLVYGDPNSASPSGCYRPDAAISVILISDEDVRSVGGVETFVHYGGEYKALEPEDKSETYVAKMKEIFGESKRFTFNSIVVKPGDSACMTEQDAAGSKSHYGQAYVDLANLTGGGVASICAADYSTSLNYFKDRIARSLSAMQLECAAVGAVSVTVVPEVSGLTWQVLGGSLSFSKDVPEGSQVTLDYKCKQ